MQIQKLNCCTGAKNQTALNAQPIRQVIKSEDEEYSLNKTSLKNFEGSKLNKLA
jgi:hypothetical protein